MGRKASPTLTAAELRLMKILWDRGSATVTDVVAALPARQQLAYNTVLTTLRILERKGYATREKNGRAHVYQPCIDRTAARRSAMRQLVDQFFESSPELLVQNLLEDERLDASELERLRRMVAEHD